MPEVDWVLQITEENVLEYYHQLVIAVVLVAQLIVPSSFTRFTGEPWDTEWAKPDSLATHTRRR